MAVVQPGTFVLTDQEVAIIQAAQMERQASITNKSLALRIGQIAVPIVIIGAVIAVDQLWYGGTLPAWLMFTVVAAFVAGVLFQTLAYKVTVEVMKQRMRETTRQLFAPRTVRLTDEGIEQTLPDIRSLQAWRGIDQANETNGLVIVWAGNLMIVTIPVRAFPTVVDAQAFVAACRRRAGGNGPKGG